MFYTGKATATPQLPPTTGLTPNPSPLGEGLGVRPVVGQLWGEVGYPT